MNRTLSCPAAAATIKDHASRPLQLLVHAPAFGLLALIRLYQRTLSPALPILTMGTCACRFSPTCSHYAADAIRTQGALRGTWLALRRLLKCTPLHPGGFDPVPPPVCRVPSERRNSAPSRALAAQPSPSLSL